jgi:hypothetical protein
MDGDVAAGRRPETWPDRSRHRAIMNHPGRLALRRLFGISPRETTFARRGFQGGGPEVRREPLVDPPILDLSPSIADVIPLLRSQLDRLHHSVPPPSRLQSPGCPAPVSFGNCRKFWTGETISIIQINLVSKRTRDQGQIAAMFYCNGAGIAKCLRLSRKSLDECCYSESNEEDSLDGSISMNWRQSVT